MARVTIKVSVHGVALSRVMAATLQCLGVDCRTAHRMAARLIEARFRINGRVVRRYRLFP